MQTQSSVFDLLANPVRTALAEAGLFKADATTDVVVCTCSGGKNVLLLAPTGTGKTEAVLLPVFSKAC